jgi:hypothetical protein
MDSEKFCRNVVTIPQYKGTCWFNCILMCLLYSEYSRKLLLKENKIFDKSNKLLCIINKILLSNYVDKIKAQKYFNIIRPEVILSYVKDISSYSLKNMLLYGWFSNIFLYKFIENLGRSCIVLDRYNNKLYAGITQSLDIIIENNEKKIVYTHTIDEIKQKISNTPTPDYIYINIWKNEDRSGPLMESIIQQFYKHNKASLLLNKYGFTYSSGIHTYEEKITFNGYEYILDSCISANYNITRFGHEVAGLKCKNNKYIYNGWINSTNDAALKKNDDQKKIPCDLMKYNWDIKDDKDKICIDMKNCKMNNIVSQRQEKRTDLCFSFGINKGRNTLIYVRLNPIMTSHLSKYESKDSNDINSATSISSERSLNSIYSIEASPLKSSEIYKGIQPDDSDYDSENIETSDDIAVRNELNYDYKLQQKKAEREERKEEIRREKKETKRIAILEKKKVKEAKRNVEI